MNDDARDKAIDRARKLLAKAEHPQTSDTERQVYTAKAAEIMMRHSLTDAVVRATNTASARSTEPVEFYILTISGRGGHGRHRASAISAVAVAYGCEVCFFNNDASNNPRTVHIVGTESDVAAMRILLPTVAAAAEMSAATAVARHRHELRGQWYTPTELNAMAREYRRSYLYNFGLGVADQIRSRRSDIVANLTASSTGAELVLASRRDRVTAAFTHRYPKLRTGRKIPINSGAGGHDGRIAGRALPLGTNALNQASHQQAITT